MIRPSQARFAVVLFTFVIEIAHASAQPFPPITNRDYGIDLYQGTAIGSARIVGMGGTSVAVGEGAPGMGLNPASAAVRPPTSNDKWDWDWTLDWLVTNPGSDHDNNGTESGKFKDMLVATGGVLGWYRNWALGIHGAVDQRSVPVEGSTDALQPAIAVVNLVAGGTFWRDQLHVGLGFRLGSFEIARVPSDGGAGVSLFSIGGASIQAGAIYRPPHRNLRLGASVALPVTGKDVKVATCDPMDCNGYILPERVAVPWQITVGVGWRRGASLWNQQVLDDWRDEKALIVAADLIITGAVNDGFGIEAFVDEQLQPSGRDVVVSVRAGAEYEWIPGWLRVRAGTYWEPARFEGRDGRLHFTAGVEGRIWSFCFWGDRYRARASLTVNSAEKYGNGGISVGLWH